MGEGCIRMVGPDETPLLPWRHGSGLAGEVEPISRLAL
jgi:hypothetical protein